MERPNLPPVILFGYDSSPFTQKVRLSLRLKQIPYTFITVPSMMPRPLLRESFGLTYRKIPVLAIGSDLYCDTSIILEALESVFPSSEGFGTLYPLDASGRSNRTLIRGFASYWTDRPFFRVTTGLIPSSVWRTHFGVDRAELIGHRLDPAKLEAKVPSNLSGLDMHLSMFEAHFAENGPGGWVFSTPKPSLADVSLFYQLEWGNDIAKGRGIANLTRGGTEDTDGEGASSVFNEGRYPRLGDWYKRILVAIAGLPDVETRIEGSDMVAARQAIEQLNQYPKRGAEYMVKTPAGQHVELDAKTGLVVGQGLRVSIAPDDTGRDDPTIGTLVGLSPEETVIEPSKLDGEDAFVDVAVHFPRIGFVIKPLREAKL
jgi:glutathione S-transferase